jgi:Protein of unknown function (DUF1360)
MTHLVLLTLATYRLSRIIIEDTIMERFRHFVWRHFPYDKTIGYLITCYWCMGFWISSLFVVAYIIVPIPTIAVSSVLAISAAAGILAAWMDR